MANVAYIRVSTAEQHTERQQETLKHLDVHIDKVFTDKCSGKTLKRPQLKACMDYLRDGDTLYINEYSRLARSTKDLLNLLDTLDSKGVRVVSLKEKLDTHTPQGEFMLTVMAGMAQFERTLMLQRQREGIAEAKKQGKYKGRKQIDKPSNWKDLYEQYRTRQITATALAKDLNVSRSLLYQWIKAEQQR